MTIEVVSVDSDNGEVVVSIAGRELTVREVDGQFAVVADDAGRKPGSAAIAAIACHAAAKALTETRIRQLELF